MDYNIFYLICSSLQVTTKREQIMIFSEGTIVGIVLFFIANISAFIWQYSKLTNITDNQQKEIDELKKRGDILISIDKKVDLLIERDKNLRAEVETIKKKIDHL